MIREFHRVTIVKIRKPAQKQINKDLQWFCESLGLFSPRDKNSSCFRVFIELLKAAKLGKPLSSDEIAFRAGLSRGTVVHHLTNLIASGLVIIEDSKYILRASNLEDLIAEIKKDSERVFDNMTKIAKELDEELGMEKSYHGREVHD
ncbi:ArsR family transcriptional regulator [Candidatus Woesearchaeota archaeon]|nr:ArsR family transcriptional regulator [Candidatus Woesearchaeota archaeon]MBW3014239.1 ArsR family transcriptional regulator [Candidatus Woesearchaeota archaeon]